ncbi:hypothetical protein RRG08_052075 [Elysia crispata]|uniref:Uncharacterized protein n=1 Tax=Elysia crispata TaxID=231223 RepID=A0AAE1A468_9GAST|nr:hypothetical protein RRG08_052075 [Elysia crispata]
MGPASVTSQLNSVVVLYARFGTMERYSLYLIYISDTSIVLWSITQSRRPTTHSSNKPSLPCRTDMLYKHKSDDIIPALNSHKRQSDDIVPAVNSHKRQSDDIVLALNSHTRQSDDIISALNSHTRQSDDIISALNSHIRQSDDIKPALTSRNRKLSSALVTAPRLSTNTSQNEAWDQEKTDNLYAHGSNGDQRISREAQTKPKGSFLPITHTDRKLSVSNKNKIRTKIDFIWALPLALANKLRIDLEVSQSLTVNSANKLRIDLEVSQSLTVNSANKLRIDLEVSQSLTVNSANKLRIDLEVSQSLTVNSANKLRIDLEVSQSLTVNSANKLRIDLEVSQSLTVNSANKLRIDLEVSQSLTVNSANKLRIDLEVSQSLTVNSANKLRIDLEVSQSLTVNSANKDNPFWLSSDVKIQPPKPRDKILWEKQKTWFLKNCDVKVYQLKIRDCDQIIFRCSGYLLWRRPTALYSQTLTSQKLLPDGELKIRHKYRADQVEANGTSLLTSLSSARVTREVIGKTFIQPDNHIIVGVHLPTGQPRFPIRFISLSVFIYPRVVKKIPQTRQSYHCRCSSTHGSAAVPYSLHIIVGVHLPTGREKNTSDQTIISLSVFIYPRVVKKLPQTRQSYHCRCSSTHGSAAVPCSLHIIVGAHLPTGQPRFPVRFISLSVFIYPRVSRGSLFASYHCRCSSTHGS